jgi:hypothetical protein
MRIPDKKRTPKKGDRVTAHGHNGTFIVIEVYPNGNNVDTQLLKSSHVERVTWNALTYLDELDESQNAARIVREATESY